jgi:choline dehydrogenase-like flavoprotein
MPYLGAESFAVMRDYNRMLAAGCLVEDTGSGQVSLDLFGEPLMRYDVNDRDFANMVRGVALTSEILFASGAREVLLPFDGLPSIQSADQIRTLYRAPIPKAEIECLTVHAMGTCRMGVEPLRSVVKPMGETWDVANLFIADASVFPGPVGVNPQITIMALATRTGRHLLDEQKRYFG